MHDVHRDPAPPVAKPPRPPLLRRVMSVVTGLVSMGFMPVTVAVQSSDSFGVPVAIYFGLLVIAFGVGAAVLWYPKSQAALLRKILLGTVTLLLVATMVGLVLLAG